MDKKWYVAFSDHHEGPFTPAEIKSKISQGQLDPNPFIWCEGMSDWLRMSETPLGKESAPKKPMAPPVPPPMAASKADQPKIEVRMEEKKRKQVNNENELSGFIELNPAHADDRTEFIDKGSLKSAHREADELIKGSKKGNFAKADGEDRKKQIKVVAICVVLFIALSMFLKFGNIF